MHAGKRLLVTGTDDFVRMTVGCPAGCECPRWAIPRPCALCPCIRVPAASDDPGRGEDSFKLGNISAGGFMRG